MQALKITAPPLVDKAFWWLVVLGFLEFNKIDEWWEEEKWESACGFSDVAKRGLMLISKLRANTSSEHDSR
jgi:hypothetical protein